MPRTRVKFCGLMTPDDARRAADAGADAIGMILHADARRRIDQTTARRIVAAVRPYVSAVGVFVDAPAGVVREAVESLGLGHAQLHGEESPADVAGLHGVRVVKALKVDQSIETTLDTWRRALAGGTLANLIGLLFDSPAGGGSGVATDFTQVQRLQARGLLDGLPPITLAGGLTPANVGGVIASLRPFAVDTSSGIECALGTKSPEKMRAFVHAVQASTVD